MNINITITRDDELKAIPTGSVCKCGCPPDTHLYDIKLELAVDRPSRVHADVLVYGCTRCSCPCYEPAYGNGSN